MNLKAVHPRSALCIIGSIKNAVQTQQKFYHAKSATFLDYYIIHHHTDYKNKKEIGDRKTKLSLL